MQLSDLPHIAILLVVIGILISISAYTMSKVQTGVTCTANTSDVQCVSNASWCCLEFTNVPLATSRTAQYAAANSTSGLGTLGQWQSTIAIVVASAIIISLVLGALMFKRQ